MEMAHSIEGRPPFLDVHLFEWAVRQPVQAHIDFSTGVEKTSLRYAMKGVLPDWVLHRPKHPFIAPPIHHSTDLRCQESIQDILNSVHLDEIPFLDAQKVRDFSFSKTVPEAPLMLILSLCLLQKRMVEQRNKPSGSADVLV